MKIFKKSNRWVVVGAFVLFAILAIPVLSHAIPTHADGGFISLATIETNVDASGAFTFEPESEWYNLSTWPVHAANGNQNNASAVDFNSPSRTTFYCDTSSVGRYTTYFTQYFTYADGTPHQLNVSVTCDVQP